MSVLQPVFEEHIDAPVICFFGVLGKKTARHFAMAAVIIDTFAAFAVMRTGYICAWALKRVAAGHYPSSLKKVTIDYKHVLSVPQHGI